MIDGNPYYFLVDTGSPFNILTEDAAERLKDRVKIVSTHKARDWQGKGAKGKLALLSFRFDYTEYCMEFSIYEIKIFKMYEEHYDGILGTPFLYFTRATIDFANFKIITDRKKERKYLGSRPWFL